MWTDETYSFDPIHFVVRKQYT